MKRSDRAPSTKPQDRAQRKRFIEAAREAGASEDEAVFDENLKRLASATASGKPMASEEMQVSFQGITISVTTQEDAYEWLLDKFIAAKHYLSEDDLNEINRTGRTRLYLAKSPDELWQNSTHLIEERRYKEMSGGWYANMNLDLETKIGVLRRFANIARLSEGKDWAWDKVPPIDLNLAIDLE